MPQTTEHTTVLWWDKPEKIMSTEEWKAISADDAPPGVFTPNMSDADAAKWKATLKRKTTDNPHVEIRKSVRGTQMLVIVALDGWTYKPSGHIEGEEPDVRSRYFPDEPSHLATRGYNVRISMNGPLWLTWEDNDQLSTAVREARTVLEALTTSAGSGRSGPSVSGEM